MDYLENLWRQYPHELLWRLTPYPTTKFKKRDSHSWCDVSIPSPHIVSRAVSQSLPSPQCVRSYPCWGRTSLEGVNLHVNGGPRRDQLTTSSHHTDWTCGGHRREGVSLDFQGHGWTTGSVGIWQETSETRSEEEVLVEEGPHRGTTTVHIQWWISGWA